MVQSWTEAEKLGLLLQVIEKAGTIPWDDLVLPEGRTKKACTVMVDKEKQKVRKALKEEANGEDGERVNGDEETSTPKAKAAGTKRKAKEDGEAPPKKPKTPRKKKETVKSGSDDEAAKEGAEQETVKPEPEEDADMF